MSSRSVGSRKKPELDRHPSITDSDGIEVVGPPIGGDEAGRVEDGDGRR